MQKRVSQGQAAVALAVALVVCFAASLCELRHPSNVLALTAQSDFRVYYVASDLVREHMDAHLYDEAGTGTDPQRLYASDGSAIATMARSKGIAHTQLYVYPPFLADALLPFTLLSVVKAAWAWRLMNLFAIALTAGWLSCLLGYRFLSGPSLLLLAGLFCFAPLWQGLHYGQVTIVLLALWCVGILLYARDWKRASALALAVGVLVKMTPLLVIVPILMWRDWRWMRWFAGFLAAGVVLTCCINSPGTLYFYLRHVVPPMSAGVIDGENKTVVSAVGTFLGYGWMHKGAPTTAPHAVMLACKLLSAVLVGAAALLTYRAGRNGQPGGRAPALAAFALLSLCISPVAWLDSYIIGCILLALLWQRVLAGERSLTELLLVFAATVAVGTSVGPGYLYWRLDQSALFQFAPLALAILLVLVVLYRRGEVDLREATERG